MTINGMDSKEMEAELAKAQEGEGMLMGFKGWRVPPEVLMNAGVEIEPFDTKLAQRIQNLSTQIEQRTLDLANLRRNAPAETSRRFQEAFARQSEVYDARLRRDEEARLEAARGTKMDVGEIEGLEEMQSTWANASEQLQELKSGLGSTVARMEKAQKAVDVLEK